MLIGMAITFFFSEQGDSDNKILDLKNSLAIETEKKEALVNAMLWCEVNKRKMTESKRNLDIALNKLNKNSEDYLDQKQKYLSKLNNINKAQYWEKCENDFRSRIDASSNRIDLINNKIQSMKHEF